jgi:hypothetical protein
MMGLVISVGISISMAIKLVRTISHLKMFAHFYKTEAKYG